MKTITWKPSKRQEQALELLEDSMHTEIFYGGGAQVAESLILDVRG